MRRFLGTVGLVLACAAGCNEAKQASLKGRVTLDGNPVKAGVIRFVPVNKDTPTADCRIVDGRYEAKNVPVTTHKVIISSTQAVKPEDLPEDQRPSDAATQPQVKEMIPARYNDATDLTVTVAVGETEVNFELKTEPKEGEPDVKVVPSKDQGKKTPATDGGRPSSPARASDKGGK